MSRRNWREIIGNVQTHIFVITKNGERKKPKKNPEKKKPLKEGHEGVQETHSPKNPHEPSHQVQEEKDPKDNHSCLFDFTILK
jgi:hypothetical protein